MPNKVVVNSNPIFYYLRNENNQPIVTVCLIEYKGDYSRGIAICAPNDQIDKSLGKWLAQSRAEIGLKILVNAEKELSAKQIRLGRKNRKYISLESIKRSAFAADLFLRCLTGYLKAKIRTFDDEGLTEFERKLISKSGEANEGGKIVKTLSNPPYLFGDADRKLLGEFEASLGNTE